MFSIELILIVHDLTRKIQSQMNPKDFDSRIFLKLFKLVSFIMLFAESFILGFVLRKNALID